MGDKRKTQPDRVEVNLSKKVKSSEDDKSHIGTLKSSSNHHTNNNGSAKETLSLEDEEFLYGTILCWNTKKGGVIKSYGGNHYSFEASITAKSWTTDNRVKFFLNSKGEVTKVELVIPTLILPPVKKIPPKNRHYQMTISVRSFEEANEVCSGKGDISENNISTTSVAPALTVQPCYKQVKFDSEPLESFLKSLNLT
ncbi:hypothetical protein TrRE_jg694 [Triparma retinervis]|uniref:Uncharacterized protein n=1 Tax=Triparma retinervis TaxID=2557542 RepID=A0A9W7E3L0_9STRA|nr:hypothetical protein TrRE_jg694 [Triparma retinervis]